MGDYEVTDLTWLAGADDEMRPCCAMLLGDGDALAWTIGPSDARSVRLTFSEVMGEEGTQVLINGYYEYREDLPALLGLFDELADLNAVPNVPVTLPSLSG